MKLKTCKLNCFTNKLLDKSILNLLDTLVDYADNYILDKNKEKELYD